MESLILWVVNNITHVISSLINCVPEQGCVPLVTAAWSSLSHFNILRQNIIGKGRGKNGKNREKTKTWRDTKHISIKNRRCRLIRKLHFLHSCTRGFFDSRQFEKENWKKMLLLKYLLLNYALAYKLSLGISWHRRGCLTMAYQQIGLQSQMSVGGNNLLWLINFALPISAILHLAAAIKKAFNENHIFSVFSCNMTHTVIEVSHKRNGWGFLPTFL